MLFPQVHHGRDQYGSWVSKGKRYCFLRIRDGNCVKVGNRNPIVRFAECVMFSLEGLNAGLDVGQTDDDPSELKKLNIKNTE